MSDRFPYTGNIDLNHRPRVRNPDGSVSTVRSIGVNVDGQETLIPTVRQNPFRPYTGWVMTDEDALKHFIRSGQHLGKFNTPEESDAAAEQLHQDQERQYVPQRAQGGAVSLRSIKLKLKKGRKVKSRRPLPTKYGPKE